MNPKSQATTRNGELAYLWAKSKTSTILAKTIQNGPSHEANENGKEVEILIGLLTTDWTHEVD